jgi:uncharacterized RDD family membrane protein YckC
MEADNYAGVTDRVKAVLADSAVIILFMFIVTYAFSVFEYVPDYARIIAFVFIFVLYDPLFTSVFGGTIGHFMMGIRVKREKNQMKNILFPLAIIRFLTKALLGWISLLTVMGSKKRKAIHDKLVGSVVLYVGMNEERTNARLVKFTHYNFRGLFDVK